MTEPHRFGFVTLSGAPNVGKSTLLNAVMGTKLSIVSRRPQTTHHRIVGIKNRSDAQVAFVDTPGLHRDQKKNLNRIINRTAVDSLSGVDLVLFMIDGDGWSAQNRQALSYLMEKQTASLLLINKIDKLADKSLLLPLIEQSQALYQFKEILPISALKQPDWDDFLTLITRHLPPGPAGFPADQLSDRSEAFFAAEFVREQLFHSMGQELPYATVVEVIRYDDSDAEYVEVDAVIWVDKRSQKPIVIGKNGSQIKHIGQRARLELEKSLATRVRLNLWVKQRQGWANDARLLRALGYAQK